MLASLLLVPLAAAAGGIWPDLDTPTRSLTRHAEDAAIVIGAEHYDRLPDSPYAQRDAELFATWLLVTRGVPPDRVVRLDDPTSLQVDVRLEDIAEKVGSSGTLWVYFAGHGAWLGSEGAHALLLRDSDPTALDPRAASLSDWGERLGQATRGQVIVVVDTGWAGVGRGLTEVLPARALDAPEVPAPDSDRVVLWTGARGLDVPALIEPVQHGAFTWTVLGALRGWADGVFAPPDGRVTVEEAQAWVAGQLLKFGATQTASRDARDTTRRIVLGTDGERAPDLTELTLPEDEVTDPVIAAAVAAAVANTNSRLAAEAEIRTQFLARADEAWRQTYALVAQGHPQAREELNDFVTLFGSVTFLVDDQELTLTAPQVSDARRLLARGLTARAPLVEVLRVEPGTVRLGSPSGTPGRGSDEVELTATVTRPFELARTEVSQQLWSTVMGAHRSGAEGGSLPVARITWADALEFCNRLSTMEGLTPAYVVRGGAWAWDTSADGYRLPTEAEWTLAARRGESPEGTAACPRANVRDTSAGAPPPDPGPLGAYTCDDGSPGTAATRAAPQDALGLYHMLGNVAEWTWDAWLPLSGRDTTDPAPDAPYTVRVVKGGSFRAGPHLVRVAAREAVGIATARDDVGLRVARSLPP